MSRAAITVDAATARDIQRKMRETAGPNSPLHKLAGSSGPRRDLEHQEQVALINWRDETVSQIPELALLVAVPNGGKRGKLTAIKLKREGVSAGYPDLILDVARGEYHGWRGELKADGGALRSNQKAWHERLRAQGYCVDVAFGWEAMRDALLMYLNLPTP